MFVPLDLVVMEMVIVLKSKAQVLFQIHVLLGKPVMEMDIAFHYQHLWLVNTDLKQIHKEIAFQFFQIQNHQKHHLLLQFLHVQRVKNLMELVDVFLKLYKNHVQSVISVMETETVFLFQFL